MDTITVKRQNGRVVAEHANGKKIGNLPFPGDMPESWVRVHLESKYPGALIETKGL